MKIAFTEKLANLLGLHPSTPARVGGPSDQVSLGGLEPGRARLVNAEGAQLSFPTDGSVFTLGRSSKSQVQLPAEGVSRQHAYGCWKDGQLWIQDRGSTRGTRLDGQPLPAHKWVAVSPGAELLLGGRPGRLSLGEAAALLPVVAAGQARPAGEEFTLPSGRQAFLETLPDGRVRLSQVDLKRTPTEARQGQMMILEWEGHPGEVFGPVTAEQLQPGMRLLMELPGGAGTHTFLGHAPDGKLLFGQVDAMTRPRYDELMQSERDYFEAENKARTERLQRRQEARSELRQSEMQRLGLSEEMLTESPSQAARLLFQGRARLGADGLSLWPKEVESLVVDAQRMALDGQEPSLVELRLEQWQAEQRGEMLLFRGNKGAWSPERESIFWSDDPGCGMHYALNKVPGQESNLLTLRLAESDRVRLYLKSGSLPGRAQYAEVYEVHAEDLDQDHQPVIALTSKRPEQASWFESYRRNQDMDQERGGDDFKRLNRLLLRGH